MINDILKFLNNNLKIEIIIGIIIVLAAIIFFPHKFFLQKEYVKFIPILLLFFSSLLIYRIIIYLCKQTKNTRRKRKDNRKFDKKMRQLNIEEFAVLTLFYKNDRIYKNAISKSIILQLCQKGIIFEARHKSVTDYRNQPYCLCKAGIEYLEKHKEKIFNKFNLK